MTVNRQAQLVDHELVMLHIQSDGRQPAELVSVTALRVEGLGDAGRLVHWSVRPVRPLSADMVAQLRITAGDLERARLWLDIRDEVAEELGARPVLVFRGWAEHGLVVRYLPDWRPARLLAVRRLAQRLGRTAEVDARWRDARCPARERPALLLALLGELAREHPWTDLCRIAELPLHRPPCAPRAGRSGTADEH